MRCRSATRVFLTVVAWGLTLAWGALTVSSIGNFRHSRTSIRAGATRERTRGRWPVSVYPKSDVPRLGAAGGWTRALHEHVVAHPARRARAADRANLCIAPEERYLRRRFGAEYEAYMGRVRRLDLDTVPAPDPHHDWKSTDRVLYPIEPY